MKQTPEMERIQQQMLPGVISYDGFLGSDKRLLCEIMDADEAAVRRMGLSHDAIAARMRELRNAGARGLGQTTSVDPHFEVTVDAVRGKLPCPFLHEGLFEKIYTIVKNTVSGESVTYTDMNIHMIEAHGFYEGEGAPFRQDPATLVRVLEIVPDESSTP